VSTIEELLGRKSSGSGLEIREYGRALTTRHSLSAKGGLASPTNGGRSVGIVHFQTKITEFSLVSFAYYITVPVSITSINAA
jgi:hypothetical protein